jgi:hypothetical protein
MAPDSRRLSSTTERPYERLDSCHTGTKARTQKVRPEPESLASAELRPAMVNRMAVGVAASLL